MPFPRIAVVAFMASWSAVRYGLGVIIRPTALGVTYGHSGFMPGYQTDMMYFPDLRTAIAVQVNSSAPRSTGRALRAFITDFAQIVAAR